MTGHSEIDEHIDRLLVAFERPGTCMYTWTVSNALTFIMASVWSLDEDLSKDFKNRRDLLRPDLKTFGTEPWFLRVAFPHDSERWKSASPANFVAKDSEGLEAIKNVLKKLRS